MSLASRHARAVQKIIVETLAQKREVEQRKLDYVQEEVRVLKEVVLATTGSARISFTARPI